jgi:hypothetical protein
MEEWTASRGVMTLNDVGKGMVRISRHPVVRVFVGVSLLACGIAEVMEDITGEERMLEAYHGVTLFGLQHLLHSLGELIEGFTKTHESIGARSD